MNLIIYSAEMWKMDPHYKAHDPFLTGRNPYYKFPSDMEVLYTFRQHSTTFMTSTFTFKKKVGFWSVSALFIAQIIPESVSLCAKATSSTHPLDGRVELGTECS